MKTPTIDQFMTPNPVTIDGAATVIDAYRRMQTTGCRHLPVVQDGKLIGLVSQRGLYRLETLVNVDRANDPVIDAMDVPYAVAPETPLLEACEEMARRKIGSCIVTHNGRVVGIFTTNDALTALSTLLSATAGTRKRKDFAPRA
jgi:acetoin utilization protein AcuB